MPRSNRNVMERWPDLSEDVDIITPYPCQTCGKHFRTRNMLATHPHKGEVKQTPASGIPKFSDEQVLAIRADYAAGGISLKALASKYDVSPSTIGRIVKRKRYTHI